MATMPAGPALLATKLFLPPARSPERWVARRQAAGQARVGWLSLDEEDNDPARFSAYLVAALQQAEPTAAEAAKALLGSQPPPSPQAVCATLINELAAPGAGPGLILALDDYHLITQPSLHAALAFLV